MIWFESTLPDSTSTNLPARMAVTGVAAADAGAPAAGRGGASKARINPRIGE